MLICFKSCVRHLSFSGEHHEAVCCFMQIDATCSAHQNFCIKYVGVQSNLISIIFLLLLSQVILTVGVEKPNSSDILAPALQKALLHSSSKKQT